VCDFPFAECELRWFIEVFYCGPVCCMAGGVQGVCSCGRALGAGGKARSLEGAARVGRGLRSALQDANPFELARNVFKCICVVVEERACMRGHDRSEHAFDFGPDAGEAFGCDTITGQAHGIVEREYFGGVLSVLCRPFGGGTRELTGE